MSDKDVDALSGVETTGHEWDGIKELNNPLPRWWLWTFYATIAWALGYVIFYPAWPLLSSATTGLLNYSSRAELDSALAGARLEQSARLQLLAEKPLGEIIGDEDLVRFARAGGEALFKVNCSQCHGTGAAGAPGYPNLNDDEWIWGGSVEQIYATIQHGSRWLSDANTHYNIMPSFGPDGLLSAAEIDTVGKYVAALSGIEGGEATQAGAQLFADNCASCHGDTGAGLVEMGGPSLTDAIWLYQDVGTLAGIRAQISRPRHGVMPAWGERLGDVAAKQLAVYVHGLGGGQ
jgi:cytochrome c oxidase cbb3-type subunit 3